MINLPTPVTATCFCLLQPYLTVLLANAGCTSGVWYVCLVDVFSVYGASTLVSFMLPNANFTALTPEDKYSQQNIIYNARCKSA